MALAMYVDEGKCVRGIFSFLESMNATHWLLLGTAFFGDAGRMEERMQFAKLLAVFCRVVKYKIESEVIDVGKLLLKKCPFIAYM